MKKSYTTRESHKSFYHSVDNCSTNKKGMSYDKRCYLRVQTLNIYKGNETYTFIPKQKVTTSTGEEIIVDQHQTKERRTTKGSYGAYSAHKFPNYIKEQCEVFALSVPH